MKKITNKNPTINEIIPDLMGVFPSQTNSSFPTTSKGVGSAPDLNNKAKSVA